MLVKSPAFQCFIPYLLLIMWRKATAILDHVNPPKGQISTSDIPTVPGTGVSIGLFLGRRGGGVLDIMHEVKSGGDNISYYGGP